MAFGYYKSATLDHTQAGGTDSSNWTLTIGRGVGPQAADANLKTVANGGHVRNANGYDIRPYDGIGGAALTYELVYYDATTGSLEMYVKIPTLSHTTDVVIYLYYGDPSLSTDGSSASTWDSSHKLVAHLPNGSTLTAVNSITGSAGTISGTVVATGQIDGGATTDGVNDDISWGDIDALDGLANLTLEMWIKPADITINFEHFLDKTDSIGLTGWLLQSGGGGGAFGTGAKPFFLLNAGGGGFGYTTSDFFVNATWVHIAVVYDGAQATKAAQLKIYTDGVSRTLTYSVAPLATSLTANTTAVTLANPDNSGDAWGKGTFDEIRASAATRSADWILSNYNCQKPSSTFIVWGSEVATIRTLAAMGVG